MNILYNILTVIDLFIAVLFTFIVAIQTSKSEGFTGGGGAQMTSARAKPGFEDQMSRITLGFGVAFMALTAVLAVMQHYVTK